MSRAKLIPLSLWLLIAVASHLSNIQWLGLAPLPSNKLRLTDASYLSNMEEGVKAKTVQSKPSNQPPVSQLTAKEKELLNCFMLRLKRELTVTGWIRIDLERRRINETPLTDLVVRYLKSKHGEDFKRVSVMGTYGLDQEMELFIIPTGRDPMPFTEKTSKSKCTKRLNRTSHLKVMI